MKTKIDMKRYLLMGLAGCFMYACYDNVPTVKELPSAAVAFTYEVIDNTYQLDYYVGANIEFTSISSMAGQCTWDFGDGGSATGNVVTYKFAVAGTYSVKLTVAGEKYKAQPIMIKDIVPIMTVDPIEGGICEVLTTPISISVELPNPEGLPVDYLWIFPEGTTDETGEKMETSTELNPGQLKFGHVGSQTVRLQVKLGGRSLEEGKINVPVAYNEEVPTLYYAAKGGNIMALKLVANKPAGMNINPFDMAVSSGKKPLNIVFNDASLYILDCGAQFTYIDDVDGDRGDGRIVVMSKDGAKVETMITNAGGTAFNDPFYGYAEGAFLYCANRNTGIFRIGVTERNKIFSTSEYPWYVQNATLGYYGNGWSYGSMNACFGKVGDTWYWCKTYNGSGIYRFKDEDRLASAITGGQPAPASGIALTGMSPKSFVWDSKNEVFYFSIYDTGYEGIYRCTLAQLNAIGGSKSALAPYLLKTAGGKSAVPITEAGKDEGGSGEFIGICQLALDEATGCVYFGLRSAYPDEVKSGLMRYNPATRVIEHVIEGVEVYGVAVNNSKAKLF